MSEDKEISAMATIAKVLDGFSDQESDVRERILKWACARYRVITTPDSRRKFETDINKSTDDSPSSEYQTFADLYHAANPQTDVDRALVAGYWLGQGVARAEFTGMDANRELKNLGHPITNITDSLQSLIDKRPALVMQTAKSGASRQARKKYKLTDAGLKAITASTRGNKDN